MITGSVDFRELERRLKKLQAVTGKPMETLVKASGRRLAVRLAIETAPRGLDKTPGEKAVSRDIRRAIMPTAEIYQKLETKQRKQFAWLLANSTPAKVNKFLQANGIPQKYAKTARAATHQTARKNGKVRKGHFASETTGETSIEKLEKRVWRRVGKAKGGWASAARGLGGVRGLRQWMTRKFDGTGGSGRMVKQKGWVAEIHNQVKYASFLTNKTTMRTAQNTEIKVLAREIERALVRGSKR
jgi:hypothetical protein